MDTRFLLHWRNQEPGEGANTVVTIKNVQTGPQLDVHFITLFQHQHSPVGSVHIFLVAVVIVGSYDLLAVFAQIYAHAGLSICKSGEAKVVHALHWSGELSCRMKGP